MTEIEKINDLSRHRPTDEQEYPITNEFGDGVLFVTPTWMEIAYASGRYVYAEWVGGRFLVSEVQTGAV